MHSVVYEFPCLPSIEGGASFPLPRTRLCFTDNHEDKLGCLSGLLSAVYAFCDKRRKELALLLAFTLTQSGKDTVIPKG